MKILAIQIANGFSSEARVLATLLAHRSHGDALVLHHEWTGDTVSPAQFRQMARTDVAGFDMGWRPHTSGLRSIPGKLVARARFRLRLPALYQAARRYDPDVLISNQQIWDCSATTYLATLLKKPQIIHLHYNIGWWLRPATLSRLRTCEHVITVSDFIRQQAIDFGIPPARVTTIHNAMPPLSAARASSIDVRMELGLAPDAQVLGFVARLDPYKGHSETIQAFAKVAHRHVDAHLVIVGDGQLAHALRMQAQQTSVSSQIHFLGRRSDIPRLLNSFDVFVHPSYDDPCPLAVLEAAAAGLPVVAFHSGGIPEIIPDGEAGLLAPPGDTAALAEAMHALLRDHRLRRTLGQSARQRVESTFTPEIAGTKATMILERIAADARLHNVAAPSAA